MSVLRPWSGPFDIFSIQGMRLPERGSPCWIGRMGHGDARPCGNAPEVCPKEIPVTKQIGQIKKRIYDSKHSKT